jgi:lysophospholipase L1-like esterase
VILLCSSFNILGNSQFVQNDPNEAEKWIMLFSPRGTEFYFKGSNIEITWEHRNLRSIKIEYSTFYGWETIESEYPAKLKSYMWTLDEDLPEILKIRVSDQNDPEIFDVSPFEINIKENTALEKGFRAEVSEAQSENLMKIMPLGNSITLGYQDPQPEYFNGYRKPLKQLLDQNGLKFDFVGSLSHGNFNDIEHEGHGGWHAKHWHNNKKYSIADSIMKFLNQNPPDIVLLHIGTNDIGEYFMTSPFNDNTIDTTVADISGLIDSIYLFDPEIQIIIAKIIDRIDDPSTSEVNEYDTTLAFNTALANMVNNRILSGDNLKLVDMETTLVYPDDLIDDAHPNDGGYDKMAVTWFEGVMDILPKINLTVFLQGAYTSYKTLNAAASLPNSQPFNNSPWNYNGGEVLQSTPNNIVDWVLVSLRTTELKSTEVAKRAGLLKTDGSIVDLDGSSPLAFPTFSGEYYIVIEHRNHLPIMSPGKILLTP